MASQREPRDDRLHAVGLVDRDTNVAHHIWTSYPDGRDPRSFHGNYPEDRSSRPWMEMSIRAIPGSHRYVADGRGAPRHAFASLVLIDPRAADDNAMSQPRADLEVPFPESERHLRPIAECMVYGTPALSEDDYLCVRSHNEEPRHLLADRFGNRNCCTAIRPFPAWSPMPPAPRPKPPVLPAGTTQTAQTRPKISTTVAAMNIYESDLPNDAKVAALRVIQVLPKTTPPPNEPRSASPTRAMPAVLGTVPARKTGARISRLLKTHLFARWMRMAGHPIHAFGDVSARGRDPPAVRIKQRAGLG